MKISIKGWERKGGGGGGVAENGRPLRAGLSLVQYLSSSLRFNPSYTQTASPISPPPPPRCHSQPACSNTHRLAAFIQLGSISKYFPAAFYILSILLSLLFYLALRGHACSGAIWSFRITQWWPVVCEVQAQELAIASGDHQACVCSAVGVCFL